MYVRDNPFQRDVSEIQLSRLLMMISSYMGGKAKLGDFAVSAKFKTDNHSLSVQNMTEEQINQLAGV